MTQEYLSEDSIQIALNKLDDKLENFDFSRILECIETSVKLLTQIMEVYDETSMFESLFMSKAKKEIKAYGKISRYAVELASMELEIRARASSYQQTLAILEKNSTNILVNLEQAPALKFFDALQHRLIHAQQQLSQIKSMLIQHIDLANSLQKVRLAVDTNADIKRVVFEQLSLLKGDLKCG